QEAHGLDIPLVLSAGQRFQLRLSRVIHARRAQGGQGRLQLPPHSVDHVRGARYQRLSERRRQHLPHLLHLRARPGYADCRLRLHGPGPEGTGRGRPWSGVASAPRRVFRLMAHAQMLSAGGLIRTSRRRGFCPACRLFQTGDGPQEIAAPALIALAFLIVAALAWIVTIARMSSMEDMPMGLGPLGPFVVAWPVVTAAL